MLCVYDSQLNVRTIEDLDSIRDELIGMPVLMRVWLELVQNTYTGAEEVRWEGDMALLIDTSHPMIRPEVEAGLEEARRVLQDGGKFCLQVCCRLLRTDACMLLISLL